MKKKLETICVVIVLILSIANIKLCADAINTLSDNTQRKYISQGDIKSKQYLVQEGYISRITPKTEVEVFVEQIGIENIDIYRNTEKNENIEEGLVATGMVMTLKEYETTEGTDYELSVVGDINRDGRANIVEAVQIINHIVGLEGKELTGLSYMSGDINGDKEINIVDVSKLIRYIVFEELEIGEVEWEEPPVEEEAEEIPEKEIGKIYAIEDLVDLATMVNNGTFEEEYRKVHGEEAQIVVTLERNLDFKDVKTYRTENPETMPYTDEEGNGIDANGDGTVEPIMVELTTGLGFMPIGMISGLEKNEIIYNSFKGTFDGKNNTISNLHIDTENEVEKAMIEVEKRLEIDREELNKQIEEAGGLEAYFIRMEIELCNRINTVGLFGVVEAGTGEVSEIKNLNVKDANLNGFMMTQGIVAMTHGNGEFKFSNSNVVGLNVLNMCSDGYTSGMVGTAEGAGTYYFSECNIKESNLQEGLVVAGLLGQNMVGTEISISKCKIENSQLNTSGWYSGGVLGYPIVAGNVLIEDCEVTGTLIKSGEGTAGIAVAIGAEGFTTSASIYNCKVSDCDIIATEEEGYVDGLILVDLTGGIQVTNSFVINSNIQGKEL